MLRLALDELGGPRPQIEARTPSEFRGLLAALQEHAQLGAGQISAKTGMARSTTYALADPKRSGLPQNVELVKAYAKACKATDSEIGDLTTLWHRFRDGHPPTPDPAAAPPDDVRQWPFPVATDHGSDGWAASNSIEVRPVPRYRLTGLELLRWILGSPTWTRAAIRLLAVTGGGGIITIIIAITTLALANLISGLTALIAMLILISIPVVLVPLYAHARAARTLHDMLGIQRL